MAHRIRVKETAGALHVEFEGVLDAAALGEIAVAVRLARRWATQGCVKLVLDAGTEVDPECIEPLRRLDGVSVCPVSAFLARWLRAR